MSLKKFGRRRLLKNGYILQKAVARPAIEELINEFRAAYVAARLTRIGGDGDGGYMMPDDFDGISHCFSPGVSVTADFEEQLARDYGVKSFMADASVDNPPMSNPLFEFDKKFLGAYDDETFMTLNSWVTQKLGDQPGDDLVLQMDIEGAEFDVLIESSVELLSKFRMMVIEFHEMERIFERHGLPLVKALFRKIHSQFAIVHVHANNFYGLAECKGVEVPPLFEVSYLRRDRLEHVATDAAVSLPHPQDCANVPGNADVVMPDIWWRG